MRLPGRWREGFALDYHTVSSTYLGDDEYGHPMFDTKRSDLGELLYRLKYRSDASVLDEIVQVAARFYRSWNPGATLIVPVAPSRSSRPQQPVSMIADTDSWACPRIVLRSGPGHPHRHVDLLTISAGRRSTPTNTRKIVVDRPRLRGHPSRRIAHERRYGQRPLKNTCAGFWRLGIRPRDRLDEAATCCAAADLPVFDLPG